ncbi:transposon-encoded TnpW family protein [Bacteroides acidifaciens]|uniref:transposon-encoded TnpW family protein n=1 Tax=Bacteroides acidifaciens TaxID=85831 RepID=UPI0030151525
MNNEKITEDITTTAPAKDAPALVKKIDWTTYIVRVHFSKTSKETLSGKIKRMLKNEIQQM